MPIPGSLTTNEAYVLNEAKKLLPERFVENTADEKILAYMQLVLDDFNVWPPLTGYTFENIPLVSPVWGPLKFGACFYAALFYQMRASLEDFNWNDNGLTVAVDQVGKIDVSLKNLVVVYQRMMENSKKNEILLVGAKGIGSPRWQSQLGQFLKIALGSAFVHGAF